MSDTELTDKIVAHGIARYKEMKREFNECDFLAGAMAALAATGNWDKVPPSWFFNAWRGVSSISPVLQEQYHPVIEEDDADFPEEDEDDE